MKTIAIALFVACLVGSSLAQDCSAKFKDFHKCLEDSHKKNEGDFKAKFEALKPKLDACYTDNGCTPPAKPEKKEKGGSSSGAKNDTAGGECRKAFHEAMKSNFEACIKKSIPDFTPMQKDGQHEKDGHHGGHKGGHKGWNHKDENKALDGCAKKEAVRDCKRALFNSSKPTDSEKKAGFQARCDAKQSCLTALGADCQAKMEKFKKAACECGQQQHQQADQIRSSVSACNGVEDKKKGKKHDDKQKSCDEKDYCKLGYDAFAQDHQKDHEHH